MPCWMKEGDTRLRQRKETRTKHERRHAHGSGLGARQEDDNANDNNISINKTISSIIPIPTKCDTPITNISGIPKPISIHINIIKYIMILKARSYERARFEF